MKTNNLPALFIENAVAKLRQIDMMRLPRDDMPTKMRDEAIPSHNDWIGWKIIPSTVTNGQLDRLEEFLGLTYPPIYRQFLQSYHFYDLLVFRFQEHPIHDWQNGMLRLYEAYAHLTKKGLIPFGEESRMDAGAVCFDTTARLINGDCPVVFWDHDWIGTEKEINPMFSSGEAMFSCLNFMAEAPIDFTFHDARHEPSNLPLKQKLMAEFLALDPTGAGGTAINYWTMDVKS